MKHIVLYLVLALAIIACNSSKVHTKGQDKVTTKSQDTVRIANDSLAYEIIIIEPGFNSWLNGRGKPRGYYSQNFLESRNQLYVAEWNRRVLNTNQFDTRLYEMQIDYNSQIDYGYEVNYLLYYYFIYFQRHYKQQLIGFVSRL
ncbi:MAG: hypothetical protein HRT67_07490 [Flavobacteriaceae bacterium]|nr:hypothetical protein [Flavobacteriaceae bacterium]